MFNVQLVRCDDSIYDESEWQEYRDALLGEFAKSVEAAPLIELDRGLQWTAMYLDYVMSYHAALPVEITASAHNEVLFHLIPRKVMVEAEYAAEIVDEIRAFWQFMDREYRIPLAKQLVGELDDAAVQELRAALADDGNFGMAKSIFSLAKAQGYDITDESELQRFLLFYNLSQSLTSIPNPFDEAMDESYRPANKLRGAGWTKSVSDRHDKRKKAKAQRQAKRRNRR
jgi:hypothetical protein